MTEGATHVGDRPRTCGRAARRVDPDGRRVRAALSEVPDPELPVLSIVDLGIVHRVDVDGDGIRVEILPTFVGCPALDLIRDRIADTPRRLRRAGPRRHDVRGALDVGAHHAAPAGDALRPRSASLRRPDPEAVRCPFCCVGARS